MKKLTKKTRKESVQAFAESDLLAAACAACSCSAKCFCKCEVGGYPYESDYAFGYEQTNGQAFQVSYSARL